MPGAMKALALSFGELTLPIDCLDPETEQRLRAQLRQGKTRPKVTVLPAPRGDKDVEGHTFAGTLRSVLVHVRVGDSGEPQAVRVHFPSTGEAEHFRRNLLATGVLAGTLALGTFGAASLANRPLAEPGVPGSQATVQTSAQSATQGVVLPGSPYSGKAAITESLDLQQPGTLAEQQVLVPGNPFSGKAAVKESLDLGPAATATDQEVVLPGSPYSGKAAVEESLK